MNGTIRIHQTKALISGRKTLSPQDMAPMYILARDIDDRKTTAAMRLRLIRTYDIVQSRYSDRVRSRECVFHDEEGSYVHLNIPGNNVSAANSFIEGHVYCLKNFLVISLIYTYRTCSSDFMLQYYHKTLVKQYKGLDFPRKMFRLQPFDSIKSLEGIDPKHVEKVIPFCQYDLKEPVIVLIQMCRVKVPENSGEVKICSSYDATQLLFNHECDECTDFRDRCNKKVDLKGGMYVCGKCGTHCDTPKLRYKIKLRVYDAKGSAPFLLWDREALELLGGITAEELKAMQPKVPTKIPKEIVSLVGRGMLFKINVERDRLEKRNLAFPVMQIKDDIAVVNEYCPGMLKVTNQKSTNSYEQLDDDFDSDEGFFSDEEAESPLPNPLTQVAKGGANDSEAVKRRLLDEFSSTQVSKKKTHTVLIKVEKDSGLAIDQNSQNIEI
nr:replication protein A 70 kDa DNA-binding subunit B-like [Ipomoea batatas]